MKKKIIMAAIAIVSPFCLTANATDKLEVNAGKGSSKIALGDIKGLKFSNDKLLVYTLSSETPVEFNLAEIVSLKFIDDSTDGIEATTSANKKFSIRLNNGILSATGLDNARTAIYNTSGQCMLGIEAWDGSAISIESFTNGVYVLVINNQSFKFVKK